MIEHVVKEIPLYEQFGVFMEAPKRRKKRKPRVMNGAPSGALSDYTNTVEPEEDLNMDDMEMDDITDEELDDLTADADADDPGDDTLETDDPDAEEPADDGEDYTADADGEDGGDGETPDEPVTDDGGTQTDGQGDGGGTGDNPDTGDGDAELDTGEGDDDLTADADADGGEGGDETPTDDASSGDDPNGQKAFKKEDMKKYLLFKKLKRLYQMIRRWSSKLDIIDSDNKILTSVHKEVKKKMKELESLVYDYLLLKFANDSYVSASYFYEQVKVSVLLLLQMLDNSHKDVENMKNKKKSSR